MILFWLRELAGWILLGLGLFLFYVTFSVIMTEGPLLLESVYLTIMGVFVFRAGVQMLRVSVAGRVCLAAQARLREEEARAREQKPLRRTLAGTGRG